MTGTPHTPTPWTVYEEAALDYRPSNIYGANGDSQVACLMGGGRKRAISKAEERANAAFIVRAVNAHDDLVKALGPLAMAAGAQADVARQEALRLRNVGGDDAEQLRRAERWQKLHDDASAALAKAGGAS